MNEDMMMFMVYNFLKQKFDKKDKPQEEEEHFLDHLADKAAWERDKKVKAKEQYIRTMMQTYEEETKPRALPLPPVME